MAEVVRLSGHRDRVEEVRGLLRRYILLPDVWELLGSLPLELPEFFADEAQEEHGVIVRLTPDIYRGASLEEACDRQLVLDVREYDLLSSMGIDTAGVYDAGVRGALCDEATRQRLAAVGQAAIWVADSDGGAPGFLIV